MLPIITLSLFTTPVLISNVYAENEDSKNYQEIIEQEESKNSTLNYSGTGILSYEDNIITISVDNYYCNKE